MNNIKSLSSFLNEAKETAWSKLNKIADEMHGEYGFASLNSDDMSMHIDMKNADKLADKMYGEFGFETLSEVEMEKLINSNPKLVKESTVNEEASPNAAAKILIDKLIDANLIDKNKEKKASELLAYFIARGMHETSKPELGATRLVDKLVSTKNLDKDNEKEAIDLFTDAMSSGVLESAITDLVANNEILDLVDRIHEIIKELKKDPSKDSRKTSKLFNDAKPLISKLHGLMESADATINEGTDIGSWNQGGPKADQNVLVTKYVGPKDVEEFGLGRSCMQINVGQDYIQLNPADIVELKELLKSYKVK